MSKKKKDGGIGCLLLIFGWLVFILLALIFYFYFMDKIDIFGKEKNTEATVTTEGPVSSTAEQFETKFAYQTNANLDINSLIIEFYAAKAVCDQDKLKSLVTDPSKFDDMTQYEQMSQVITHYSNINCYTLPGYTDDSTLLYVTCNINISGVTSVPMDITQFYIVKTAEGYKINNSDLDASTVAYIEQQGQTTDIQELYHNVKTNIDNCMMTDPTFAEFYNKINGTQ